MSGQSTILTFEVASKCFPATEFQNLIRNLNEKSVQRRTGPNADCTRFLKWFYIQLKTVSDCGFTNQRLLDHQKEGNSSIELSQQCPCIQA